MRVLCVRNVDFEGSGIIEAWAHERGHSFTEVRSYAVQSLPSLSTFDFLLVMGGPQSLLEIEKYDYLLRVVDLIQGSILSDKYVLGVCLGAQLISHACGASAEKSPETEIGVFPVALTDEGKRSDLLQGFPPQFDATHWHEDMAGLPENATVLASSEGCPRQIIQCTERVYGLQCHMEMTYESIQAMLGQCVAELRPARYIQSADQLAMADYASINNNMRLFLDRFVQQ